MNNIYSTHSAVQNIYSVHTVQYKHLECTHSTVQTFTVYTQCSTNIYSVHRVQYKQRPRDLMFNNAGYARPPPNPIANIGGN